ncbi:hypothetical protein F8566_19740 [Actinomadura rudentiformis]|uniref:Uncharacterized protein n=1 Tax=Actinomadura rudentiformis TaxID=359158 RepID=A0A6H9YLY0_9ACTN|nr:hypothetical protein F8566_19740 [Actinomadura rudentiformis]
MTARPGVLNWRAAAHWGGGRRLPCVHCGHGAFYRDETGRPCHKTCAEAALTRAGGGGATTRGDLSGE